MILIVANRAVSPKISNKELPDVRRRLLHAAAVFRCVVAAELIMFCPGSAVEAPSVVNLWILSQVGGKK